MFFRGATLEGPEQWVKRMAARSAEELRDDVRIAITDLASKEQVLFQRMY